MTSVLDQPVKPDVAMAARIGAAIRSKALSRVRHRRDVLKEKTGLEANEIAMEVAHLVSAAINTSNKAQRRRLKAAAIKLIEKL